MSSEWEKAYKKYKCNKIYQCSYLYWRGDNCKVSLLSPHKKLSTSYLSWGADELECVSTKRDDIMLFCAFAAQLLSNELTIFGLGEGMGEWKIAKIIPSNPEFLMSTFLKYIHLVSHPPTFPPASVYCNPKSPGIC